MKSGRLPNPDVPFFNTPITKSVIERNGGDRRNGFTQRNGVAETLFCFLCFSVSLCKSVPSVSSVPVASVFSVPTLVELPARRRLLGADASGHDLGARIVFALHVRAGKPPQHRELADMRERVGDRTLKELLRRRSQRRVRREIIVEPPQRRVEPLDFAAPRERLGIGPRLGAFRLRQRPVVEAPE